MKDRFFRAAPEAWSELLKSRRVFEQVTLRQVERHGADNAKGPQYAARITYKRNGTRYLQVMNPIDGVEAFAEQFRTYGGVAGINELYAFQLVPRTPRGAWVLKDLVVFGQGGDTSRVPRYRDVQGFLMKYDLLMLAQMPLPEMVKKPHFKVLDVRSINENGEELVEVAFEYRHPPDERIPVLGSPVMFEQGRVVLDPRRSWVIKSYEISGGPSKWGGKSRLKVRCELQDDVTPRLRNRESQGGVENLGGHKTLERIERVELSQAPPREDFTLTAFGLPEPPGITWKKPTPLVVLDGRDRNRVVGAGSGPASLGAKTNETTLN